MSALGQAEHGRRDLLGKASWGRLTPQAQTLTGGFLIKVRRASLAV